MVETRDVKLAIIRCWEGSGQIPESDGFLEREAAKARDGGIEMIAAYCWPPSQLGHAISNINGVNRGTISFLAADQEAGARVLIPEMMNDILDADIDAWVYTSAGSWNTTMGSAANAPWLKDYDLWLARYPFRAEDTPIGKRYREWWPNKLAPETHAQILGTGLGSGHGGPFGARQNVGPWNRQNPPKGWQHAGTCRIEGHDADLNVFEESVLGTITQEEPMAVTDRERLNEIRWYQAVQQMLDKDATILESVASTIRGGRKVSLDAAAEVTLAVARRTEN